MTDDEAAPLGSDAFAAASLRYRRCVDYLSSGSYPSIYLAWVPLRGAINIAPASTALGVIGTHKPFHHDKFISRRSIESKFVRELDETRVAQDEDLQRIALGAWLRHQMDTEGFGPSPMDMHPKHSAPLALPPLLWFNYKQAPSLMKVTNTGSTVIVSAKWESERPYLLGGPFRGSYVFSQLHFHWGADNDEGAEHSMMSERSHFPLEMHVAHFKTAYKNQERALREADGTAIVGYWFRLDSEDNIDLNPILRALPQVREPKTSFDLPLTPLANVGVAEFEDDYFFYYGSVEVSKQSCPVMWIIWPNPLRISSSQVCLFREMLSKSGDLLERNFRPPRTAEEGKNVFFIYGGPIIPKIAKNENERRRSIKSRRKAREDSVEPSGFEIHSTPKEL